MKHVSILLLENANTGGLDNARQGLTETNAYLQSRGLPPAFDIELVGLTQTVRLNGGMYAVRSDRQLAEVEKTDVIILPPVQGDIGQSIAKNHGFREWINAQYSRGAEVMSLCLGAFILGHTGLLNGRDCVTHWRAGEAFRKLYPEVRLTTDKILTDRDRIYTGGGAFSSVNLILYFIEKSVGREAAVYCSKIFQVDLGRHSQSPFIIFQGQKDHGDALVEQLQEHIEENYDKALSVAETAFEHGVSRRTLERRFKKATGNSFVEYTQRVRMEACKRRLEHGTENISEVQYGVGYTDAGAFRTVFKKHVGMTPREYRSRFSREAMESL